MGSPAAYTNLQLGRGGKTLIIDQTDAAGIYHVWSGDVARGVLSRVTAGTGPEVCPVIGPDGRVAFTHSPAGTANDIFVDSSNGAGSPEALVVSPIMKHANHFSPDGRFLIYDEHNGTQRQDLWVVAVGPQAGGARTPVPFLTTGADEAHGQFSPDSKWIAYASDESGRQEVYVRSFAPDRVPAAGPGKWLVSTAGGDKPRWRSDGEELFYLAPDGKMMAVPVKITNGFEPGIPISLFETRVTGFMPYDVRPDGRFLINTPPEAGSAAAGTMISICSSS